MCDRCGELTVVSVYIVTPDVVSLIVGLSVVLWGSYLPCVSYSCTNGYPKVSRVATHAMH